MEGYRLRSAHGDTLDPRQPLVTDSVEAQETTSQSSTLTYNGKAAAGAVTVNSLPLKPIISIEGDQVASYWGNKENLVFEAFAFNSPKKGTAWINSVTETATAAAVTIYNPTQNLEEMFESVTGTTKRFIIKVIDTVGGSLYGWIRGVSVSSNVYTFEVYDLPTLETARSWVGTLTSFDNTKLEKVEIYHYNTSLVFGTGTTLTQEVACPAEYSKSWEKVLKYAETLSNGQYFVDYMRGRIVGVKADTTASETVTYNIWANTAGGSSGPASNVNLAKVGGTTVVTGGVAGTQAVGGIAAHDASGTGIKPVVTGGIAASAKPAAVSAGDVVQDYTDLFGRKHVYDEGGGGVSGGGYSTWCFTPTNSFGHGTSAYGSGTTFTVSGHSFTPEAVSLVKVDRFNSSGAFQETISPSQATITCSTTAGVTTYTYAGGSFSAGDLFVVYQGGPERTTTVATDSQRTEEISPMNQMAVQESWVDTINVGAGPTYYPSSDGKEMTGIKSISFTGKFVEGDAETNTFTVEGTNDEDSTSTSRDWSTLYGYRADTDTYVNSITCNATTVTFAWDFDSCNYKYVRAKWVGGASATNTVILKARTVAI